TFVFHNSNHVSCDLSYYTRLLGGNRITGVNSNGFFHAGTHQWCFRLNKRHSLTRHVSTHKRTVSIAVRQKWHQGGCRRHHLTWRYVHVVNIGWLRQNWFTIAATLAGHDQFLSKRAVLVYDCVGLRDLDVQLIIGSQVLHNVGVFIIEHFKVWGFNKTKHIDPTVGYH